MLTYLFILVPVDGMACDLYMGNSSVNGATALVQEQAKILLKRIESVQCNIPTKPYTDTRYGPKPGTSRNQGAQRNVEKEDSRRGREDRETLPRQVGSSEKGSWQSTGKRGRQGTPTPEKESGGRHSFEAPISSSLAPTQVLE